MLVFIYTYIFPIISALVCLFSKNIGNGVLHNALYEITSDALLCS
jgi:hypothetical protein